MVDLLNLLAIMTMGSTRNFVFAETESPFGEESPFIPERSYVPDVACPQGADLLPHRFHCNKFYSCSNGKAYEKSCPDGLNFNPVLSVCDWPANVICQVSDGNLCGGVKCMNGGVCDSNDRCFCPRGFTGLACQTPVSTPFSTPPTPSLTYSPTPSFRPTDGAESCEGVVCLNGGFCLKGFCACAVGFYGERCQNWKPPSAECLGVNCENGGVCFKGICNCLSGYSGSRCQKNQCDGIVCLNGGNCLGGWCFCINGFWGARCEKAPVSCIGVVCQNGGFCVDAIGVCECVNGYSGIYCQSPPDVCADVICFNGGFCKDGVCQCQNGFEGTFCDAAKTPPSGKCGGDRGCENGGICILGGCNCFNGFEGKFCEIDTGNGGTCSDVTNAVFEVSASSSLPGFEAENGFAGPTSATPCDNSTCDEVVWHSLGRPPQWLAVDFGSSPRALCAFNFGTRLNDEEGNVANDAPQKYEIQYADDDRENQWKTAEWYVVMNDWKKGDMVRHDFVTLQKHRFWRLLVTNVKGRSDGSTFVVIRNFQLFAKTP